MTVTAQVAQLCRTDLPARLGEAEREMARRCVLDSLAVAYAAADSDPIAILLAVLAEGPDMPNGASVIGHDRRLRPQEAAEANGMMVSLLLYDDNHSEMRGHPSAPLFPAVLALAEARDLSISAMLDAFVVGFELECRLGMVFNPSQYEIGWHATATQGALASAAACALMLGLDEAATCRALGIAASSLGGIRRNFGTMTMSFHSGLAAAAGLKAARLAALGFTAAPDVFDGETSLGHALSRDWDVARLAETLPAWGDPFCIVDSGPIFKLFPTGRPTLAPIECALALRDAGVRAQDIEKITCEVSFMYPRTLIHARPKTALQGKTSMQYCVATTLLDGRPGMAAFTDEAVNRAEIRDLIEKIEVVVPPHLGPDDPAVRAQPFDQPVTVTVRLRDGSEQSETVKDHRGTQANPVTEADLLGKFTDCTAGHLRAGVGAAILALLRRPDASTRDLMHLLGEGA